MTMRSPIPRDSRSPLRRLAEELFDARFEDDVSEHDLEEVLSYNIRAMQDDLEGTASLLEHATDETRSARILDAEKHVWCPTCKAAPGEPCRVTKAELRLDPNAGLHVDHDGETCVHLPRISRADVLADGSGGWRRDELYAVVRGLEFHREGRAS